MVYSYCWQRFTRLYPTFLDQPEVVISIAPHLTMYLPKSRGRRDNYSDNHSNNYSDNHSDNHNDNHSDTAFQSWPRLKWQRKRCCKIRPDYYISIPIAISFSIVIRIALRFNSQSISLQVLWPLWLSQTAVVVADRCGCRRPLWLSRRTRDFGRYMEKWGTVG